jgi:hypothetical protein
MKSENNIVETLDLLKIHYSEYMNTKHYADKYKHPYPIDTRAWSQIIVSALTGVLGYSRKKGPDLEDGSDVKAANCWDAIDTPRFNGCIKAGTQAHTANSIQSLDSQPNLFFVMWDTTETSGFPRCRIWVVRPPFDTEFRRIAEEWYRQHSNGTIKSDNFQLHPPRNLDNNIFRNTCGNLQYPLLFEAHAIGGLADYEVISYNPSVLKNGLCKRA